MKLIDYYHEVLKSIPILSIIVSLIIYSIISHQDAVNSYKISTNNTIAITELRNNISKLQDFQTITNNNTSQLITTLNNNSKAITSLKIQIAVLTEALKEKN